MYWLIVHSAESYQENPEILGFRVRSGSVSEVGVGDRVVYYAKGIKKLIGIFKVEEKGISLYPQWENSPYQFRIRPEIVPPEPLSFRELVSELKMFKGLKDIKRWGTCLHGPYNTVKRLSKLDYRYLERLIKEQDNQVINLLNEDHLESFYSRLMDIAFALSVKYWKVTELYSPEDVVQEVVLRVARRGIRFDPSKSSLPTFCYMLVNSTYINLARSKSVRVGGSHLPFDYEPEEGRSFSDVLGDEKSLDFEGEVIIKDFLDRLPDEGKVIETSEGLMKKSLREVIKLKKDGYTNSQISDMLGISHVRTMINKGMEIFECEYGCG